MTDIMDDLDGIWKDIAREAKKSSIELDVKISIFDKGLKYASIKYKVQPDEIEGSAWNVYSRTLKGNDSGGKGGEHTQDKKGKGTSTNSNRAANSSATAPRNQTSSERYGSNGSTERDSESTGSKVSLIDGLGGRVYP